MVLGKRIWPAARVPVPLQDLCPGISWSFIEISNWVLFVTATLEPFWPRRHVIRESKRGMWTCGREAAAGCRVFRSQVCLTIS